MANFIRPTLKAMTPLTLYKTLVGTATGAVRYSGSDLEYVPLQFGGVFGQAQVLSEGVVLTVTDFKIESPE